MKIKYLIQTSAYLKGAIVDATDAHAANAIARGFAVEYVGKKEEKETEQEVEKFTDNVVSKKSTNPSKGKK